MNTKIEIFNYLNLVSPRLGNLYKASGYNPMPDDFSYSKEDIAERLFLNQMESSLSYPPFLFEDKKILKKRFKTSLIHMKKILKSKTYESKMSADFAKKFETYLVIRIEITNQILREFKNVSFDECDAYLDICSINPVFFDLMDGTFGEDFNEMEIISTLEANY